MDKISFRFPENPFQQKQQQETKQPDVFADSKNNRRLKNHAVTPRQTIFDKLLAIFTPHLFPGQISLQIAGILSEASFKMGPKKK